ncbi:hypothetical protein BC936DRAFT_147498 [Jimgerdemannia flammicorona]|uniref:Uncharacterized protein n=1 Tax=Jimgerdemannia flammicorona TaxID=994334 RepID=A0A433D5B5_9FUNG|nr:hypothetical protein BC936DRAFT_147498 [Jimgerdemannia flammicorona]
MTTEIPAISKAKSLGIALTINEEESQAEGEGVSVSAAEKKSKKSSTGKTKRTTKAKKEKDGPDKLLVKERIKVLGKDPEQAILNAIQQACTSTFSDPTFTTTLQSIKTAFFARDYLSIFTVPANLPTYTAAYIPARSLCYYTLFRDEPLLQGLLSRRSRIFLPGSGSGSELMGITAAMLHASSETQRVELRMQDIGEWGDVLGGLEAEVRRRWGFGEELVCGYERGDVLGVVGRVEEEIQEADLITFMFVMNELFVEKARAMEMVKRLVGGMKKGAWLLVGFVYGFVKITLLKVPDLKLLQYPLQVVDSAGSFSHLKVGGRTYMVYFLLDALKDLEKLISEDSKWYRWVSICSVSPFLVPASVIF